MPDKNFKDMATRFMDIWQRQVESFMKDPTIMLESMNAMQKMQENMFAAQNFAEGLAKSASAENNPWQAHFNNFYGTKDDGKKTSTSAVYNHGDDDFAGLSRRIRDVEQRLSRIEQFITLLGQKGEQPQPRAKTGTAKRNKKTGRRKN